MGAIKLVSLLTDYFFLGVAGNLGVARIDVLEDAKPVCNQYRTLALLDGAGQRFHGSFDEALLGDIILE